MKPEYLTALQARLIDKEAEIEHLTHCLEDAKKEAQYTEYSYERLSSYDSVSQALLELLEAVQEILPDAPVRGRYLERELIELHGELRACREKG